MVVAEHPGGEYIEPTVLLEVKLLGNPVHNSIKVDVMGAEHNFLQLSLYDMLGGLVGESRTLRAGTIEHYQFDVSAQPAGHLLLRVSSRGQSKAVRIVKLD